MWIVHERFQISGPIVLYLHLVQVKCCRLAISRLINVPLIRARQNAFCTIRTTVAQTKNYLTNCDFNFSKKEPVYGNPCIYWTIISNAAHNARSLIANRPHCTRTKNDSIDKMDEKKNRNMNMHWHRFACEKCECLIQLSAASMTLVKHFSK